MPKTPGKSPIWQFFTLEKDGKAKCNTCGELLKRTRGSTSCMAAHLTTHNQALPSQVRIIELSHILAVNL